MSHPDQVRRLIRSVPDKTCVVEGARSLSFGQVDERADRAAEAWLAAGLTAGDRVAVLAHNELEYLELQIAAQRAQLVLVPLNTRLRVPELQRIVDDCAPALLVHGPDLEEAALGLRGPAVWHLGAHGAGPAYEDRLSAAPRRRRPVADPEALATLLYTSGTTGSAKGAMITNRALLARAVAVGLDLRLGPEDVFLQTLPMFHLAQTFSCAFAMLGATNVLMRTFDPGVTLDALARHRVTHTLTVPTILGLLLAHPALGGTDRRALRAVLYGGAPIRPAELTEALRAFGCDFYQMYGMTETGPATLLRPAQHDPARPELLASAGREIVTFELDVRDEVGEPCAPGRTGEIVIGGPALMTGYWAAPEASEAALRGGVMHTGDVGHLGEDGLLVVTDRLNDLVITGGENVSPVEVEHVLLAHPSVDDCAVVGVPDPVLGERVHAVLVCGSGAPDVAALDRYCRERLAGYKCPRGYSRRAELPRTPTGKVRRHRLGGDLGDDLPAPVHARPPVEAGHDRRTPEGAGNV